jgi:hypothetical protein
MFAVFLALFTGGNSTRETLLLKVLNASVIVWELAVEIIDCVP